MICVCADVENVQVDVLHLQTQIWVLNAQVRDEHNESTATKTLTGQEQHISMLVHTLLSCLLHKTRLHPRLQHAVQLARSIADRLGQSLPTALCRQHNRLEAGPADRLCQSAGSPDDNSQRLQDSE